MIGEITPAALHASLSGLAQRSRVTADNIANIETPNFHARRVQFESALADNIADGGDGAVQATVAQSLEPTREDGNNVNLDAETLLNVDTNLRYQLATQAVDNEFASMRIAMRTS